MLLDFIYPPVCGICGNINKNSLCKKCEIKLKEYEIYDIEKSQNTYYDYKIKILKYEKMVRYKMLDYKFNEKSYLYKTFEKIILNNKKIYSFLKKYDIMLCVPMRRKKQKTRGYNQSELIAKEIAKELEICYLRDCLIKIKDTKKQSTLTRNERKINLNNAFGIKNKEKIQNKNVILFDDIFTTGSTMKECSKILKDAGVKKIAVLTLATD